MPFCQKCGKQNSPEALYCNSCGNQLNTPTKRIEITHKVESAPTYKMVQLRHAYCDGKGVDRRNSLIGVSCKGCEGSGYVSLNVESSSTLVECRNCDGTGVDHRNSFMGVECKPCHGTGKIPQRIQMF